MASDCSVLDSLRLRMITLSVSCGRLLLNSSHRCLRTAKLKMGQTADDKVERAGMVKTLWKSVAGAALA